jgi:hypothetical protein
MALEREARCLAVIFPLGVKHVFVVRVAMLSVRDEMMLRRLSERANRGGVVR